MKQTRTVLFGAGHQGKDVMKKVGKLIDIIVDNDSKKWNTALCDTLITTPDVITPEDNVYVAAAVENLDSIFQQLDSMGITNYYLASSLTKNLLAVNEKMISLKNKFSGQKCVIIGTGPSLRISDLENLQKAGYITFGSNKIFKLFDDTDWRPDLYCVADTKVLDYYYEDICNIDSKYNFVVDMFDTIYANHLDKSKMNKENIYLFKQIRELEKNEGEMYPTFSTTCEKYVIQGLTVTYSMMQIAFFLGFEEVYLIGVDFNYKDNSGNDKNSIDHFCKNYMGKDEKVNPPMLKENLLAYMSAEKFTQNNNFQIFNATRGGKLEIFERVNIDSLI